jgi:adenylylsulfate kinase
MTKNITWHNSNITQTDRSQLNEHNAACIWFTGLSGSGKSTLAVELEHQLYKLSVHSYILDGDNIRHGLNKDLGFSDEDREENIRRIGEVARLFVDAGLIVITAFISPFRKDRDNVRKLFDKNQFIEIFVDCDLKTCEERDPKGLYKKARQGEIKDFTGIDSPYEKPLNPELKLYNDSSTKVSENVKKIINYLKKESII